MAKSQPPKIVVDKVAFLLGEPNGHIVTGLISSSPMTSIPYLPSNLLGNIMANVTDNTSILEVLFYQKNLINNSWSEIATINIYKDTQYKCYFSFLSQNIDQFQQLINSDIKNPNLRYSFKKYSQQYITALSSISYSNCSNGSIGKYGRINISPANTPVIYERLLNGVWITVSTTTTPFNTTINGIYRVKHSFGCIINNNIVFSNLAACLPSSPFGGGGSGGYPNSNLIVSPNPVSSSLEIAYQMEELGILDVRIVDISSKEIIRVAQHLEVEKGYYLSNVDVSHLAKGMYFVHLFDGKKTAIQKIVKAN